MQGFVLLLFVIFSIADVTAWLLTKNSPSGSHKTLLLVLAIPQAVFLVFVLLRIAVALMTGARV